MRGPTALVRETPSPAAHEARRALLLARLRRSLVVTVGVAAFLTATNAFAVPGTLGTRFAYWMAGLSFCGVSAAPVVMLFERKGWLEGRPLVAGPLLVLGVTIPVALMMWGYNALALHQPLNARLLPGYLAPCLVVSAAFVTLNMLIARRPPVTHAVIAQPGEPATAAHVRFLDRLPPKLRGADLFAVSAEDHYLRLHTSRGSDLILFRLADAVAELDGLEGAQTHRSWWVAKDAVAGARRGDGRAVLLLPGGVEAPVSRTYARALREDGWF